MSTPAPASDDVRQIEDLLARQVQLWNRHDIPAYSRLWADDCDFVNVLGMHRTSRAVHEAELTWLHSGRFRDSRLQLRSHRIRILASNTAVILVHWELTGDPGQPGHETQNGTRQGVMTHVAVKGSQGWYFVASQNTDRAPIADPFDSGVA